MSGQVEEPSCSIIITTGTKSIRKLKVFDQNVIDSYFRNIVRAERKYYDDWNCHEATDAEGRTSKTRWVAHTRS